MDHKKGITRRKIKVRNKIKKTAKNPRLVVSRSLKHIYAQILDNKTNKTILTVSDKMVLEKSKTKVTKLEKARLVGEEIAKRAAAHKIKSVVYDRSGFKYHGRIKALADGARGGGLKF